MVAQLVEKLSIYDEISRIIVTLNIPEKNHISRNEKITLIENSERKGFSANNNAAFLHCKTQYFCVVNPDIECLSNPFPQLVQSLDDPSVAVAAPLVTKGDGGIEVTARRFPSVASLAMKSIGRASEDYPLRIHDDILYPHWIAGMFMLFRTKDYRAVGGFDENFYLYYEDVDICARLWESGRRVLICPSVFVVHNARRSSHRYWRYRLWHARGLIRYFRYTRPNFLSGG